MMKGAALGILALTLLPATLSNVTYAAADTEAGKQVYMKANCVGCHKWHGGGGGGYGGAALSLRETQLDAAGIEEVVRCGRPTTRMPYHDRQAYKAHGCYGGLSKGSLGHDFPPQAATFLRDEEIAEVVKYVVTEVQGKGDPTKADCIAFWGSDSRECASMK